MYEHLVSQQKRRVENLVDALEIELINYKFLCDGTFKYHDETAKMISHIRGILNKFYESKGEN